MRYQTVAAKTKADAIQRSVRFVFAFFVRLVVPLRIASQTDDISGHQAIPRLDISTRLAKELFC